jgi:hypothetical protein
MFTNPPPPDPILFTDAIGNQYSDGRSTLTIRRPSGRQDIWSLPDEATGSDDFRPWLIPIAEGRFLLFNADGHIVRLNPAGNGSFTIEANFDHGLTFLHSIRRAWLDPASRVDVSYGDNQLAIIFPNGRVDPQIADQILPRDLKRIVLQ